LAVNVVDDNVNNTTATVKPLLHELQLGERLNQCIHESRRSDFSLMLAMLCDDVREQSQFVLPKSLSADGLPIDKNTHDNKTLRKYFDLPEQAPLSLGSMQQIDEYNQGQLIANNDLITLHLSDALSPKPLSFRNEPNHIPADIIGNTSLICQEKHANPQKEVLNKPLNMQVEQWLKLIQHSVVSSKVVDVAA
jgi:hypothetical protein